MPLELPNYLIEDSGEHLFANTRISLTVVLHYYNERGYSAEMLALDFPSLNLATIYSFLGFYHQHKVEMDGLVAAESEALAKIRAAAPQHVLLSELRRRLQAKSHSVSA